MNRQRAGWPAIQPFRQPGRFAASPSGLYNRLTKKILLAGIFFVAFVLRGFIILPLLSWRTKSEEANCHWSRFYEPYTFKLYPQ